VAIPISFTPKIMIIFPMDIIFVNPNIILGLKKSLEWGTPKPRLA
jgi:hypothetical protein